MFFGEYRIWVFSNSVFASEFWYSGQPYVLIRNEQMDAFRRASDRVYEMRLLRFLKHQFPDAAQAPDGPLLSEIREQIANARAYGIVTERQIATYITSAWLLGGDFDGEFPAAQTMLNSEASGKAKSEWLEQFTKGLFAQLGRRI